MTTSKKWKMTSKKIKKINGRRPNKNEEEKMKTTKKKMENDQN